MVSKIAYPLTKEDINKLGNTIVFLCERLAPVSKSKLLKLIYLFEENSVRTYGLSFFNLKFFVWKSGSINRDIFVELSSPSILENYIGYDSTKNIIVPLLHFSDDEFSDNEIYLLKLIVEKFKSYSSEQLDDLIFRKHSLWYQTAKKSGFLEYFENNSMNSTDVEIDFTQLIENDPMKLSLYLNQKDYLEYNRLLSI